MQHITVPLPDGVAPTVARRIAVETEAVVNRRTGALVNATVTDLAPLNQHERRLICEALDCAAQMVATFSPELSGLLHAADLSSLRARLNPDTPAAVVAAALRDPPRMVSGRREVMQELTRQQECAADAMAAEYGRSRVRPLSDGAVVIVGMTDDVERRSVCVERDGQERWRS
jgi:hypothetical protein